MIQVISGVDAPKYPDLFRQVHALRHAVFVEEMGWEELRSPDGQEVDQFDDRHAIHHVAVRDGKVAGYQRMLPTTRPHLLSTNLRYLCADRVPASPATWEVTRYCVAPAFREGRRAVGSVGSAFIAASVEWALSAGVTSLLYAFETSWIGRAMQLGFLVHSLGFPTRVANQTVVAAELIHGPSTLDVIRDYRGQSEPVIEFVGSLAAAPMTALAS